MDLLPINEAAAEAQLAEAYTKLTGKQPDTTVQMVCRISAARALSGARWEWRKTGSKNWSVALHWI
jgi:hypothetical protein